MENFEPLYIDLTNMQEFDRKFVLDLIELTQGDLGALRVLFRAKFNFPLDQVLKRGKAPYGTHPELENRILINLKAFN